MIVKGVFSRIFLTPYGEWSYGEKTAAHFFDINTYPIWVYVDCLKQSVCQINCGLTNLF